MAGTRRYRVLLSLLSAGLNLENPCRFQPINLFLTTTTDSKRTSYECLSYLKKNVSTMYHVVSNTTVRKWRDIESLPRYNFRAFSPPPRVCPRGERGVKQNRTEQALASQWAHRSSNPPNPPSSLSDGGRAQPSLRAAGVFMHTGQCLPKAHRNEW